MAKEFGSRLTICHVIDLPMVTMHGAAFVYQEDQIEEMKAGALDQIKALVGQRRWIGRPWWKPVPYPYALPTGRRKTGRPGHRVHPRAHRAQTTVSWFGHRTTAANHQLSASGGHATRKGGDSGKSSSKDSGSSRSWWAAIFQRTQAGRWNTVSAWPRNSKPSSIWSTSSNLLSTGTPCCRILPQNRGAHRGGHRLRQRLEALVPQAPKTGARSRLPARPANRFRR
jgi:hypothetical protein